MSSVRIAKLEALLARVNSRRGRTPLHVVSAEPVARPALTIEPELDSEEPGFDVDFEEPAAARAPEPTAFAAAPEPIAAEPEPAVFEPAKSPSFDAALEFAASSEAHDAEPEPAAARAAEHRPSAEPSSERQWDQDTFAVPEPEPQPEPEPEPEPEPQPEPEPAVQVSALSPTPRMSIPARPSLPSTDFVPDALPFTLMTDRPPALPTEQDSLDLAAIALSSSTNSVIGSNEPVRVEVQAAGESLNVTTTTIPLDGLPTLSTSPAAVTVVPGRPSIPTDQAEELLRNLPSLAPPAIIEHAQPVRVVAETQGPESAGPEQMRAVPPVLHTPPVITTSALKSSSAQTFGALLDRSLALRPRSTP